ISVSRSASSNCVRNSPAILRRFEVMRPNALSIGGRSFGPTTTISTIPMKRSSVQPISSIQEGSCNPACRSGPGAFFVLFGLVLDRLCGFRCVVLADALLEALDALGNITHQFRYLATAKQHEHDDQNDQPMPD